MPARAKDGSLISNPICPDTTLCNDVIPASSVPISSGIRRRATGTEGQAT